MFNCSSRDKVSQDLSIIAPDSSSNLIFELSVIPLRRKTSDVRSSSFEGYSSGFSSGLA
jgi:hypothetical protein